MICQVCKYHNQTSAKYCENCGNLLEDSTQHTNQHKVKKKKKKKRASAKEAQSAKFGTLFNTKTLWIVVTIILCSFLIISIINSNASRNVNGDVKFISQKSANPLVEAKVFEIASKFVCGCGGCDEDPLEHCKCNYAVAQREFIRERLENSESEEEVFAAVVAKYGGLKDESNMGIKAAARNLAIDVKLGENKVNTMATYLDLAQIYNAFECPCGQCGIKELSDCTCNHARGAVEVKAFINDQIAKNEFTVQQVIDKVAQVYGGKKI